MTINLAPVIDAAAQEWNLDPALLHSVSQVESGQQAAGPDSSAGATGPLQVMPGTAADMGATNPRDPVQNVYAGAKYLSQMLDRYGQPELALAAYNAGPGRVDDYLAGRATLPDETQAYVPKVAAAYQRLSGAQDQPADSATPAATPTPAPYQVASADTGSMSDAAPDPSAPPAASAATPGTAPAADPFSQMMQAAAKATPGSAPASVVSPAPAMGQSALQPPVGAAPDGSTPPPTDPFSALMAAASRAGTDQRPQGAGGASAAVTGPAASPGLMSRLGSGIASAAFCPSRASRSCAAGFSA